MGMRGLVMLILAGVVACAPPAPGPPHRVLSGSVPVAVLPFESGGELDTDARFAARVAQSPPPADLGEQVAISLSRRLGEAGVTVVAPATVQRAMPAVVAAYDPPLAVRVARAAGAELAVLGAVMRYEQREGSDWGVTTPATVWYEAALVRVADGAVVDRRRFQYTQQPLMGNLLDLPRFLQGGGRWQTREQILDGALTQTAEQLAKSIETAPTNTAPAPAPRQKR